ncbi:hypothetical protein DYB28_013058, partial [Aphanomyces astaci]
AYTNGASLPTLVAEHDLENLRLDRHESALKRENQLLMHMLRPSEAHAMVVRNFQKMMQRMFAMSYSLSRVRGILGADHNVQAQ